MNGRFVIQCNNELRVRVHRDMCTKQWRIVLQNFYLLNSCVVVSRGRCMFYCFGLYGKFKRSVGKVTFLYNNGIGFHRVHESQQLTLNKLYCS